MKSTSLLVRPPVARLVCGRCGMVALPGTLGWRALTAVSHAGPTLTSELAGHEVAIDLCRHCLRDALKAALGIQGECVNSTDAELPESAVESMRWVSDAEALLRAGSERLDAWRNAEAGDDGLPAGRV